MVWAAMGVFGAITSAVNNAWGVEKQPSYFKHKLISFVMLVSAGLPAAGRPAAGHGDQRRRSRAGSPECWLGYRRCWCSRASRSRSATTTAFIFVVGLVFYFVPNAKVRFRDVWVGAVITGTAVARRTGRLFDLRPRSIAIQRPRLDCRRRRLPGVDLHLGDHPPLRRRNDRRLRPPPPPSSRGRSRRAHAENLTGARGGVHGVHGVQGFIGSGSRVHGSVHCSVVWVQGFIVRFRSDGRPCVEPNHELRTEPMNR